MSDRAYSVELNRVISALEAHGKSISGELKDAKAFHCCDPLCNIQLTCSNWGISKSNRIYFTPSDRNSLHSIFCSAVDIIDGNCQSEIQTTGVKKVIRKSRIISMTKLESRVRTNESLSGEIGNTVKRDVKKRNSVKGDKNGTENRNISSIKSYIDFYYDDRIDNDEEIFRVDGEVICLNTLFVKADEPVSKGVNRIFHGMAKVTTPTFNDELIAFKFENSGKPMIYSNKKKLFSRISPKILNRYIDTEIKCYLFFRGCIRDDGKFKSYNGRNYCDLWIEKE